MSIAKYLFPLIATVSLLNACAPIQSKSSTLNVEPYLTDREREVLNNITFEVQKVLDTIDSLRSSGALDYVTKLDIPGWKVEKKEERVLFLTQKKFIAYKDYTLPESCIKNIGGAELNVCHMKLSQTLKKLGEAYNCDVETYSTHLQGLKERVKVICPY